MPIGPYLTFADCVAKNQDKDDPAAYCASIEAGIEDRLPQFSIVTAVDGEWVRARPAGWNDVTPPEGAIAGGAGSRRPLEGLLTIVDSTLPNVRRFSVGGITVDPSTVTRISPPLT